MNFDNRRKISEEMKRIGYVDVLSTEQLIKISCNFFNLVSFCDCKVDRSFEGIAHQCNRFKRDDYVHNPTCKCCQKRMLLYYLGRCMGELASIVPSSLMHTPAGNQNRQ